MTSSRQMAPQDILCFQHCDRYWNILCYSLPESCPVCRMKINETPCRIPPYVIPPPFSQAWKHPCSIVIRPTFGTFLSDYSAANSLLHVGITSSNGIVYDYDEEGVNIGSNKWDQCIVIELREQGLNREMMYHWDKVLNFLGHSKVWTAARYDANEHNCFDFVLTFLKQVGFNFENWAAHSRLSFTQNLILPHTTKAAKYITLYRNIAKDGVFCQILPEYAGVHGPSF